MKGSTHTSYDNCPKHQKCMWIYQPNSHVRWWNRPFLRHTIWVTARPSPWSARLFLLALGLLMTWIMLRMINYTTGHEWSATIIHRTVPRIQTASNLRIYHTQPVYSVQTISNHCIPTVLRRNWSLQIITRHSEVWPTSINNYKSSNRPSFSIVNRYYWSINHPLRFYEPRLITRHKKWH